VNVLIDSSVWIDHIRSPEPELASALSRGCIIQHPFVTAEVALGSLKNRRTVIATLNELPQASAVSSQWLLNYIEEADLHGTGIGMVDAHLLASAADGEGDGIRVWTRDKRLARQAERLGLGYAEKQ
jgi:predicted nucleic acid-binding protein